MSENIDALPSRLATRAPRRVNGRLPSGCRTIQLIVPESVHFHVQAQASLSRMDLMDYVYCLLTDARPLDPSSSAKINRR
jgi:hypothetical protein